MDGRFERSPTEDSLWIVVIYLDGTWVGGETEFPLHDYRVVPEAGLFLAFRHRPPHAAAR